MEEMKPRITGHTLRVKDGGRKAAELGLDGPACRPIPIPGAFKYDEDDDSFKACLHFNPLAYVKTCGDAERFADWFLANFAETADDAASKAAHDLLCACVILLRDWFLDEYYSLSGVLTLFTLAEIREDDDEGFMSALDLVFYQIKSGEKYVRSEVPGSMEYEWRPSEFVRKSDGARPGQCGGLSAEEDFALGFYEAFREAESADKACALRLCCEGMNRLAARQADRSREFLSFDAKAGK